MFHLTRLLLALAIAAATVSGVPASAAAPEGPEIFPLSQIKPGMKGVAYSIFQGDQIEKFEVEMLGVMPSLLGPKQDIVLIKLLGPKVEETGVVAGMSGSPVYIDGKLAGAISLKFGIFTKEPIGGMTPIEEMLDVGKSLPGGARPTASAGFPAGTDAATAAATATAAGTATAAAQYAIGAEWAARLGVNNGAFLKPIDTPLVFSGFYASALARFSDQWSGYGMVPTQGGSAAPQPGDADLQPGDMAGLALIQGDLTLHAGCTVTARVGDRVFICGHPVLGMGNVALPLARGHVLTTLSSSLESTKIMNTGAVIGTVLEDRVTAVMGKLGPPPMMVPVELAVETPTQEKEFHFQVVEHPKLTPLLIAIATYNGLVANTAYSEGTTFQLDGEIDIVGHSPVKLENMFAPTDMFFPDGFMIALNVENVFARVFNNPYEQPAIQQVQLHLQSIPQRRWAAIDSAWSEKSEVNPGETIRVKVLLRPYRGAPFIQEVPVTIPAQAAKGYVRILVSDSETLNHMNRYFASGPQARLPGLEELIKLLNRERRNDRLYVTLLQPTPTLLVEDKEMPNAPLSEINVLDQRRNPGNTLLLYESSAGEWSVPMSQVISGQQYLTIRVK